MIRSMIRTKRIEWIFVLFLLFRIVARGNEGNSLIENEWILCLFFYSFVLSHEFCMCFVFWPEEKFQMCKMNKWIIISNIFFSRSLYRSKIDDYWLIEKTSITKLDQTNKQNESWNLSCFHNKQQNCVWKKNEKFHWNSFRKKWNEMKINVFFGWCPWTIFFNQKNYDHQTTETHEWSFIIQNRLWRKAKQNSFFHFSLVVHIISIKIIIFIPLSLSLFQQPFIET